MVLASTDINSPVLLFNTTVNPFLGPLGGGAYLFEAHLRAGGAYLRGGRLI